MISRIRHCTDPAVISQPLRWLDPDVTLKPIPETKRFLHPTYRYRGSATIRIVAAAKDLKKESHTEFKIFT